MWIESHQSIRNHPKVKKAARLAGVNQFEMIGLLHCLWWWALDYAPDGNVSKYSSEDIESAIDWSGTPGALYSALIECGFNGHCGLLEKVDGAIVIHDWYEYGGKLLDRREANADRMRERRAAHVQYTTTARAPATDRQTEQTEQTNRTDNKSASQPRQSSPLPAQAQVFIDAGGKLPTGNLSDGTPKRDNAVRVICETVKNSPDSLTLWRQVVAGYTAQWSPKSYTVMLNEYYLQNRIPGQPRQNDNGNGRSNGGNGNGNGPTERLITPEMQRIADKINADRRAEREAREAKQSLPAV